MNFKNPSPDLQDDIDRMQEEYSDVALQQSWQKRYLPLIITGKS
jgi:hypothetical protein